MSPERKPPGHVPPSIDIPLLTDVVEDEPATTPAHAVTAAKPAVVTIPQELLSEMLTERIAALTDRLLREAAAEIHATLVDKVWDRLREEIPEIVEEALKENGQKD